MRKGIRIIERLLKADKVAEEVEHVGQARALGCLGEDLHVVVFAPFRIIHPRETPQPTDMT